MDVTEYKKVYDEIKTSEKIDNKILNSVKDTKKKHSYPRLLKVASIALACILLSNGSVYAINYILHMDSHVKNKVIKTTEKETHEQYLIKNGFDILHRNYRCKLGEIDIIAKKDDIIRFIEVKFRGSGSYGSALEAVDFRKQRRIMRAASWFLNEYGLNDAQCSFDVMTVENNEARYYFNCYGGI